MKTKYLVGILCISWAAFALPAAAQNGRQTTPANSTMCDDADYATPGLKGLCVALCEAQGCTGEYNPMYPDKVEYGPNCGPSAKRLVANYVKLAGSNDPIYPGCITPKCPCWTRGDLTRIGGNGGVDKCSTGHFNGKDTADFQAGAADGGKDEFAVVSFGMCRGNEASFKEPTRFDSLSDPVYNACVQTVVDECSSRGILD